MNPNSALIWLPAIQDVGLPVPRTEVVRYNPQDLFPMLDGQKYADSFPLDELRAACARIGFPVFLRSDLSSAKHSGHRAWRIDSDDEVVQAMYFTFEDNELKWIAGATSAFLVREFLPLKHGFTAFNGLPIARERRFFADQKRTYCSHPYWPEDAFERQRGLSDGWQAQLAELSTPPSVEEFDMLQRQSIEAARAIGHGAWSVDWAQDTNGKWWLIDMATAAESWHPECGYVNIGTPAEPASSTC